MFQFHFIESPPPRAKRDQLAMVVMILAAIVGLIVTLQHTRYALFAPEKTGTFWGILNGLIFGFLLINSFWEWKERRNKRDSTR